SEFGRAPPTEPWTGRWATRPEDGNQVPGAGMSATTEPKGRAAPVVRSVPPRGGFGPGAGWAGPAALAAPGGSTPPGLPGRGRQGDGRPEARPPSAGPRPTGPAPPGSATPEPGPGGAVPPPARPCGGSAQSPDRSWNSFGANSAR